MWPTFMLGKWQIDVEGKCGHDSFQSQMQMFYFFSCGHSLV